MASVEERSKAYAEAQLQRKLAGQRIVMNEDILRKKGYDPGVVKSYYTQLTSSATTRRELGRVAGEKIKAKELGLTYKERQQLKGFTEQTGATLASRQPQGTAGDFTGKVEVYDQGTPIQTRYLYEGKETGRIVQTGEGQAAIVKQPSKFKFKQESVELGQQGVSVEKQQVFEAQVTDTTQVSEGMKEKLGNLFGKYAAATTYARLSPLGIGVAGGDIVDVRGVPIVDIAAGASASYTKEWFVRPYKQAALVVVGAASAPVLNWVGSSLGVGIPAIETTVGITTPAITTAQLGTAIGIGATGYYVYTKAEQFKSAETWYEKGGVLGIAGAEMSAVASGRGLTEIGIDWWRTRGLKEVKTEKLVPEDVLSGKNRFAMQPKSKVPSVSEQINLFKYQSQRLPGQTSSTLYHATGNQFWKTESGTFFRTIPGTSELPGLYGSYGVSPAFLRVDSSVPSWLSSFNIFQQSVSPGVYQIKPAGFVGGGKTTTSGYAFVPGIKTEVEAIIPPGSYVVSSGQRYFFNYAGRNIPITEGFTLAGTAPSNLAIAQTPIQSSTTLVSSSSTATSTSVAALSSFIPSTSSRTVTKSYTVTSSSSIPSYSPPSSPPSSPVSRSYTSTSSYVPPSTPSSISSYVSPSKSYVQPSSYYVPKSSYKPPVTPSQPKVAFKLPKVLETKKQGKFPAYLRRFGTFRIIGYGSTPRQAVRIGKQAASYTLGATFKVPSFKGKKVAGFRTKQTKEGTLFIEPKRKRLKKKGRSREVTEIQYWRNLKV